MLHAQNREFNSEFGRGTTTAVAAIFSLVAASVLAFVIAPASVFATSRAERSNHRIRVPSAAAAANAVKPMSFPLPFAPIDVDRTDDTAAASACTAAPNDCSLRGAVAFANAAGGFVVFVGAVRSGRNLAFLASGLLLGLTTAASTARR